MAHATQPRSSTPTHETGTTTSDPTATLLNSSCLDFLLIELVPMADRITAELAAREEEWLNGSGSTRSSQQQRGDGGDVAGGGSVSGATGTGTHPPIDEEEAREAIFHRLETLGYRVGLGVVERFSRDKPRPQTPLDIIKFLCKDLWTLLFRKQIDNLKTNHRGIYVLTDNSFKPLSRMSFDLRRPGSAGGGVHGGVVGGGAGGDGSIGTGGGSVLGRDLAGGAGGMASAQPFLYFPAGVIRGSLAALGIQATVQAETSALPGATFQIRTIGAKA